MSRHDRPNQQPTRRASAGSCVPPGGNDITVGTTGRSIEDPVHGSDDDVEGSTEGSVYFLGDPVDPLPTELTRLLGNKGAGLAHMASVLRLPVPPGFVTTLPGWRQQWSAAGSHARQWPAQLEADVVANLARLESTTGRRFGDTASPLLVSVRSSPPYSMPGMLDTIPNVGLNDRIVDDLASATGDPRFAHDSYRRLLVSYSQVVCGLDSPILDERADDVDELHELCERQQATIASATGRAFPQDPWTQLRTAMDAVAGSWSNPRAQTYRQQERLPDCHAPAVIIQAMVFGNQGEDSGSGVACTRDPSSGEDVPYGEFLANAQGTDVVAGGGMPMNLASFALRFPRQHAQLVDILARLEAHYRDVCEVEFTIERGTLWLLQTRIAKRSGRAAIKIAVDMSRQAGQRDWTISQKEALGRITGRHIDQLLQPCFASDHVTVVARGIGASPGAAVGRVRLSPANAVAAADRGEPVILVRHDTSTEDVHGMSVARGILTRHGGLASHAAVVARGWGIPAVVGIKDLHVEQGQFTVRGITVREGDWISIDGSVGRVVLGPVPLTSPSLLPELDLLRTWVEDIPDAPLDVVDRLARLRQHHRDSTKRHVS